MGPTGAPVKEGPSGRSVDKGLVNQSFPKNDRMSEVQETGMKII